MKIGVRILYRFKGRSLNPIAATADREESYSFDWEGEDLAKLFGFVNNFGHQFDEALEVEVKKEKPE